MTFKIKRKTELSRMMSFFCQKFVSTTLVSFHPGDFILITSVEQRHQRSKIYL
jgi:hypothetical protein